MNFVRTTFLQLHSASIIGSIEECHYKCIIPYGGFNTPVYKLNKFYSVTQNGWMDLDFHVDYLCKIQNFLDLFTKDRIEGIAGPEVLMTSEEVKYHFLQ